MFLEDFGVGVAHESPPHLITEEEVIEFARRYDPQYFHMDPQAAKDSVFGGIVCSGYQTAALTWALALKTGMFADSAIAGIGIDELRWLAPVRPGDLLRCRFTLLEWRHSTSRPEAGLVRMRYELLNQEDRPVTTMVMAQMLRLRPA